MDRTILKMIVAMAFGFGFWYIIFFFLTMLPSPLDWHWVTKSVYLFLSVIAAEGIFKGLNGQ